MIKLLPTDLIAVLPDENEVFHFSGTFLVLGYVNNDTITFDFEPYLFSDKVEGLYYKYGSGRYGIEEKKESFYALLKENGLVDYSKLLILKSI